MTHLDEPAEAMGRWERRKGLARLVRVVVFLAPAIIATDLSLVLTRLLPHPEGIGWTTAWWITVLAVSGSALYVFDRMFRRLLPLTVLLDLALVFPGVAPSRFSAAFRGGTVKNLQRRIEQAKTDATSATTAEAAATVVELVGALALHDPRTRGHSERTRAYAELIAEELGLSSDDRERLRWSALLHDIGKLHVTAGVLNKVGKPNPDEWESLQQHPTEGARIAGVLATWLGPWGLAIVQHHERFDGGGYPHGLRGEEISLAGRIVAVADAYEVMTSARSYAPPVAPAAARQELVSCAGGHFDPEIVHAFLRIAVAKFPRRVGLLVAFAQIPGLIGIEQLLQQAGSAIVAGTAVTGLAVGGLVAPAAEGLGGFESLGRGFDPSDRSGPTVTRPAPTARTSTTVAGGFSTPSTEPAAGSTTTTPITPGEPGGATTPPTRSATTVRPTRTTSTTTATTARGATTTTTTLATTTTTAAPVRRTSFLGAAPAGTSPTPAPMQTTAPSGEGAADHDGDGVPGRTLDPSGRAEASTSPDEHQAWIGSFPAGTRIVGTPVLQIASAVAGFGPGRGTLRAVLLDCDAEGLVCAETTVSRATLSEAEWTSESGTFAVKTLTFAATDHVVGSGRTLVLRIGVPMGSEPLVVAYGTATHPSSLAFDVA